jgi:hypothetical protein
MPQLVKGGKRIYGWTIMNFEFRVRIPAEAHTEYGLHSGEQVIIQSSRCF